MSCHCKIFRHGAWAEPVPSTPRLATTGSVGFTEGSSKNEVVEMVDAVGALSTKLLSNPGKRWGRPLTASPAGRGSPQSASLTLCVLSDLSGNSMPWRKCRQSAVYHSRWAKENGKYSRTELHSEMEPPQAHLLQ